MVTFTNVDILDKYLKRSFPKKESVVSLSDVAQEITPHQIDVVFVDRQLIRELNKKFRETDETTDVLAFYPAFKGYRIDSIEEEDLSIGEVYVCPNYIVDALSDHYGEYTDHRLLEEVYRMIIHGILHIGGRKHSHKLAYDANKEPLEPMYVEQEGLLEVLLKDLDASGVFEDES